MDPDDARANNGMGIALGLLGRSEEAIRYFQKATQIDGSFFEAYFNLGVLLTRENRFERGNRCVAEYHKAPANVFRRARESWLRILFASKILDSLTQLHLALKEEPNRLFTLSLTANLLATCPDSSIRNGAEAVTLANRANRVHWWERPGDSRHIVRSLC